MDRLCNYRDAGKIPVSAFLDLSKAELNHTILIEKLRYCGLNDTSLNWFRSYLHDKISNSLSMTAFVLTLLTFPKELLKDL